MHHFKNLCQVPLLGLCLLLMSSGSQANPIACFHTNMGSFCIELFERHTPATVTNFLNYIASNAYTNGIFHRSVPGFVIQGGGFKLVEGATGRTLTRVTKFDPIDNEFKLSNTRGTVAMAKLPDDADSATSEWFVNLDNKNSQNLDFQNGGFTVFGRVIFDGMQVFDAIAQLPVTNLGGSFTEIPLVNYNNSQVLVNNLVQTDQIDVTDTTAVYSQQILSFAVDIGTSEALEVKLRLIQDQPSIIFELDSASITSLPSKPVNIATFSSQSGQLLIPSVMINPSSVIKNVVMQLTNSQSFQFTLQSFE